MSILLDAGVEVSFLTKGFVTERFFELFKSAPRAVFAQVGITTLDQVLSTTIEPGAALPGQRLETMQRLSEIGVETTARLDPLIPDVTDTHLNIEPLLASLRRVGVRFAAASYLFIRPRLARAIHKLLSHVSGAQVNAERWTRQEFLGECGGGQMLATGERAHRFAALKAWGEKAGVCVTPCRCKNPEFGGQECAIAGRHSHEGLRSDDQHVFEFGATDTDNRAFSTRMERQGSRGRLRFGGSCDATIVGSAPRQGTSNICWDHTRTQPGVTPWIEGFLSLGNQPALVDRFELFSFGLDDPIPYSPHRWSAG